MNSSPRQEHAVGKAAEEVGRDLAGVRVEPLVGTDTIAVDDAWVVLTQLRGDLSLAGLRDLLVRRDRVDSRLRYHVASLHGRCLGVVGWRLARNTRLGLHAYIEDLVVDVDSRNQGVGGLLLRHVKTYAREMQATAIILDSSIQKTEAHAFYESAGFARTGIQFECILPT